ncbi:amino acid adenylation domain-containing protein [Chitinophaga sp. 22536]|uniref:amino acid adenylation domain-containing protein n=1 Tax=unclassified Chitinophaga TaxID=2619133 RepID=UPI003F82882D
MDKKLLYTVIDNVALQYQEKVAIASPGGDFTYKELYDASEWLKNTLLQLGLKKGQVVAVYMNGSFDYISCILAVNKAGGIFMPLLPESPAKRLADICERVLPAFVITTDAHCEEAIRLVAGLSFFSKEEQLLCYSAAGQCIKRIDVAGSWTEWGTTTPYPAPPVMTGDDSCYIIYTSGSTGEPKIIEGVHKGLAHFIHWQLNTFDVSSTDRVSLLAPVSFDVSFRDIFLPLAAGGTVCVPPAAVRAEPARLRLWFADMGISLVHIVPSVFRLLTKELEHRGAAPELSAIRYIFLAGEPLYYRDAINWKLAAGDNATLVNLYGPSETTLAKLYYKIDLTLPDLNDTGIVPLGKPITNTGVAIMQGNILCNEGEIGEICIKTPFRTKGYWKNEALTSEKFVQNPLHNDHTDIIYRTGDLGKQQQGGEILFMGRKDGQLKIRGNRVELLEVEQVIATLSGVKQALVIPHYKEDHDILLICYYTGSEELLPEQRSVLNDYLPEYMLPVYWVYLDEFPLGINGKVDRTALPQPEALLYSTKAFVAPHTSLEKALAKIWSEILGLEKIGTQHNFFELGGHSLSATRVVSEVYRKLGIEFTLKEFWSHTTVASLAQLLASKYNTQWRPLPVAPEMEYYQLSPAQKSMWLASQMAGFEKAYVIGGVFVLAATVNRDVLNEAFKTVIARHESLRTIFPKINGEPVQKVLSPEESDFSIEYIDVGKSDAALNTIIDEYLDIPFSLEAGPLIRAAMVEENEQHCILVLLMHHIISDAWSNKILLQELLVAYESIVNDTPPSLPSLPLQYKDFSHYEHSRQQELEKDRTYWLKQLQGIGNEAALPTDYDPKQVLTNISATTGFKLGKTLSVQVRKYIQAQEVSLFMLFVSTLNILLFRYTGKNKISLGTPVAGRQHPDLERQIGLYLNYVVLRSEIQSGFSFNDYLLLVKKDILNAFDHQAYPYYQLATELAGGALKAGHPLYNVLIVMNNASLNADDKDIQDMKRILGFSGYRFEHKYSKLDISCFVNDEEEISFSIEYRTELYNPETIASFGDKWKQILELAIKQPELTVGDILYQVAGKEEQAFLMDSMDTIADEF